MVCESPDSRAIDPRLPRVPDRRGDGRLSDSLPAHLGHLLQEAADALTHAREAELAARGATERDWLVLRILRDSGPVGLPQLMRLLHRTAYLKQAPQIIDGLGEHGWLEERREGPSGLSVFALTPAGLSMCEETAAALQALGQRAIGGLADSAQEAVARFLEGVVTRLNERS